MGQIIDAELADWGAGLLLDFLLQSSVALSKHA